MPDPVMLAQRYEHGEGVPQDYRRALSLYCEAARRGDPQAFFNLGWMHLNGRGVTRDDGAAVFWFRAADAHGVRQAANLLNLLSHTAAAPSGGCRADAFRASLPAVAVPPAALGAAIAKTARDTGVDHHLLLSMVSVESAFDPRAVSPKNAMGLMQLMPTTAADLGVHDPFDVAENLRGGAEYIRALLHRFGGDLTLALAAYNAGQQAVLSHHGVPPFRETQEFVARVKRLCQCDAKGDEF
jgi:soluble lytic murein transglycosylase-like protein